MARLPPELIHIVVEHLANDQSTLYSAALTSKQFNDEATRLLYVRVADLDALRHTRFLQALTMNPNLAVFVHVYHLPAYDPRDFQLIRGNIQPVHIRASLQLMVNLKELLVRDIYGPLNWILPVVREGSQPPFQLDRLLCFADPAKVWEWAPDEIESEDIKFVGTQYRLRYLEWSITKALPISIPDSVQCISGPSSVIRLLLWKKPSIKEVRWIHGQNAGIQGNVQMLRLEGFQNLRALSLASLAQLYIAVLQYTSGGDVGLFVNLELLILQTFSSLPTAPDILRCFPKLSELIVTSPHVDSGFTFEEERDVIAMLFQRYRNLVEVDVGMEGRGEYRRWVEGRLLEGYYVISKEKLLE